MGRKQFRSSNDCEDLVSTDSWYPLADRCWSSSVATSGGKAKPQCEWQESSIFNCSWCPGCRTISRDARDVALCWGMSIPLPSHGQSRICAFTRSISKTTLQTSYNLAITYISSWRGHQHSKLSNCSTKNLHFSFISERIFGSKTPKSCATRNQVPCGHNWSATIPQHCWSQYVACVEVPLRRSRSWIPI